MNNLFSAEFKILIADDHLVIQQGLGFIIKNFLNKAVLSYANSVNRLLVLLEKEKVDLLILDINIPGGNNFKMIEEIKAIHPEIKILIFSAYEAETYALRYLKTGVNGYLEKSASEDEIKIAITNILGKGKYISVKVQDLLMEAYRFGPVVERTLALLTNRELEIARLIAKGEGSNSIGQKLDLRVSTISTHKKNIFDKLKINNVSDLITSFRLELDV